ncbi:MAG: type II toxin-antitoxin system VapB family antitoxin [Armatimonadota bacterium]|nr:type II toxin-antitoxin system VapB family antitoxin [Armatimonadota bacterium]
MPIATDLDEALIERAREATGIEDTRELLDEGLRLLIRARKQARALQLRGAISWEGDLDEMRRNRFDNDPR